MTRDYTLISALTRQPEHSPGHRIPWLPHQDEHRTEHRDLERDQSEDHREDEMERRGDSERQEARRSMSGCEYRKSEDVLGDDDTPRSRVQQRGMRQDPFQEILNLRTVPEVRLLHPEPQRTPICPDGMHLFHCRCFEVHVREL